MFSAVCVNLSVTNVCEDTSSYLTVLHSLAEEAVQQQVLQLGVPVERLFDFPQEDTAGRRETGVRVSSSPVEGMTRDGPSPLATLCPQCVCFANHCVCVCLSNMVVSPPSVSSFYSSLIYKVSDFITIRAEGAVPSDDAASSPHQSDGAVVEGPAELFGRLAQQHETLRVGDDLGCVKSLQTQTDGALLRQNSALLRPGLHL